MVGNVIKNDKGENIYVFSVTSEVGMYPKFIGYNLTTSRVDEYQRAADRLVLVPLSDMPVEEQKELDVMLDAHRALAEGTVAITARARSGKDHMASEIRSRFKATAIIRALAEPIYEINGVIKHGEQVQGKDRESLIMIGQGLRKEDPNIWIKVWLRRNIESFRCGFNKFICQDLRQPNEFKFFKNMGATIVGIQTEAKRRLDVIAALDGKNDLNTKLLNDETERNAGTYPTDYVLVNNYDEQFDIDIARFVADVLVVKKGWK